MRLSGVVSWVVSMRSERGTETLTGRGAEIGHEALNTTQRPDSEAAQQCSRTDEAERC